MRELLAVINFIWYRMKLIEIFREAVLPFQWNSVSHNLLHWYAYCGFSRSRRRWGETATVLTGQPFPSWGPVCFLENHRYKLCMQVVGIVRPLISAGLDDKLLHIENFGANEGTKFEYPSSRFSFSRSSLSLALFSHTAPYLALSYAHPFRPTWGYTATMTLWFDLSNDFSPMRGLAFIKRPFSALFANLYTVWWDRSSSTRSQMWGRLA